MKKRSDTPAVSRRDLLAAAGLAAVPAGAAAAQEPPAGGSGEDRFPKVKVAKDRVIREVVGLRPYRPGGFVVRAEPLGEKTLVNNYGHGGGGVSLSWGTGQLALELVLATGKRECAVLGAGITGLTTARLLQNHGVRPTIYARALPPDTTSNAAAAMWFPVSVYDGSDPGATTPAFREQFARACRLAQRAFQEQVGEEYGVRWLRTHFLFDGRPDRLDYEGGRELYPARRELPRGALGFPYAETFATLLIETQVYLNALLRDFYLAGGQVVARDLRSADEVARLPEPVVVNCTGMGARDLFGDPELRPVKGQLVVLLPQPEVDYAYVVFRRSDLLYMFPRRDGILLGGTEQEGVSSLEPDPRQTERILQGHAAIQQRAER